MYRNVMVPVDGSAFSREAVLQGLRIASRSGASLRLVGVAQNPEMGEAENGRDTERSNLYAMAAECRAHTTVRVTASLQYGPVVDALVGYARRHQVDLIVMRSHARRGLARAWFGSVADGLIRKSGVAVLVVRPPSPGTALERGFQFKRIIVPLDGSALAEQALVPALELARLDGAKLTLVYVVAPSIGSSSNGSESALGPAGASEVAAANYYLDTKLAAHGDFAVGVTRRVVISSDVPNAILQTAAAEEADLIAIATRGRGAIARAASGSVSDHVMREAVMSTLVVHTDPACEDAAAELMLRHHPHAVDPAMGSEVPA